MLFNFNFYFLLFPFLPLADEICYHSRISPLPLLTLVGKKTITQCRDNTVPEVPPDQSPTSWIDSKSFSASPVFIQWPTFTWVPVVCRLTGHFAVHSSHLLSDHPAVRFMKSQHFPEKTWQRRRETFNLLFFFFFFQLSLYTTLNSPPISSQLFFSCPSHQ